MHKFFENLTDEQIIKIVRNSTIDHFAKVLHPFINYEILNGEYRRIRDKEEVTHVFDINGFPVRTVLPTHRWVDYKSERTSQQKGYAYIKAELKQPNLEPRKLAYAYVQEDFIAFYNVQLRDEFIKNNSQVKGIALPDIAEDYPVYEACGYLNDNLNNIPEEQAQKELSKELFKAEMEKEFGQEYIDFIGGKE